MIGDVVDRIRRFEAEKEREIQEAEKKAAAILARVEEEIVRLRETMFEEAEKKAAALSQAILTQGKREEATLRKEYSEQAERLREALAHRVHQVAEELARKVLKIYADQ